MEHFKISIIIPSFNQGQFIERTIKSVLDQNYNNLELIVIDGGSYDNTLDIIQKYESKIKYWISEKDNGQSHAINKGFRIATGDFLTWLNSDDILMPGTLIKLNSYANKHPSCKWFTGNLIWIDKYDIVLRVGMAEKWSAFFANKGFFNAAGPSTFMRKELLNDFGMLNEGFHYMMDTELWHRFVVNGVKFIRLEQYCWALRLHEDAKMSGHMFQSSSLSSANHPSHMLKKKEASIIREKYYPKRTELIRLIYKYSKLIDKSIISRILDRKYLGKLYTEISVL